MIQPGSFRISFVMCLISLTNSRIILDQFRISFGSKAKKSWINLGSEPAIAQIAGFFSDPLILLISLRNAGSLGGGYRDGAAAAKCFLIRSGGDATLLRESSK
jgi:hypothetical protein